MLHCLPQCPTVRRQLREEVRKAGWTDEYLQKVIDAYPGDIGEDLPPPKICRKVKPDRRKIIHKVSLIPRKQRVTSKDLEHDDDRYKEKRRTDYPDKIIQDSIDITDYKEIIDEDDEEPIATLKQETVYYTEKKEIIQVAPLIRQVSPIAIKRPEVQQEREIESSIEDQRLISYEKEEFNDIPTIYSRIENGSSIEDQKQIDYEKRRYEKVDDRKDRKVDDRKDKKVEDQKQIDYEKRRYEKVDDRKDRKVDDWEDRKVDDRKDRKVDDEKDRKIDDRKDRKVEDQKQIDYEKRRYEKVDDRKDRKVDDEKDRKINDRKDRKVDDRKDEKLDDTAIIYPSAQEERPGTSKIVEDKRKTRSRDDSPDDYYKYTPEKVPSDWPHDGCDQNCPAKMLKERAEKLLEERQKYMEDRYLKTELSYFEDVCICSLGCMVHNLKKDRFVRSILTSAILFAFGIKLCSELYGWYLPNRT